MAFPAESGSLLKLSTSIPSAIWALSRSTIRPEHVIFLQIATGSAANLKPDAVLRAYAESRGETLGEFALMVTRLEVYADKGTEESHQFVTLDSFGEDIE